jgi:TolB-like protein
MLLLSLGISGAADDTAVSPNAAATMPAVALMPFANYTDQPQAIEAIMPAIEKRLAQEPIRIVSHDSLRATLRKYRIRALGAIDVADIARLARDIDIRYLLLGSVDFYKEGDPPEAGFSMRLVDISDMKIIWAVSDASNGADYAGLFGIGRIDSMPALIPRLTDEAFKSMGRIWSSTGHSNDQASDAETTAIVPFDNISDDRYGGDIVAARLLAELVSRGVNVIEPVILANLFLENARTPRGEIDLSLLQILHSDLNVDYVITGTLYRFKAAQPGSENSRPEIELAGRCLDAARGTIVAVYDEDRAGEQTAALIRKNSYRSLGKLTGKVVENMLNSMETTRAKSMAGK